MPDVAPIPEVAHELLASVLTHLKRRYSRRDLTVAARILAETTDRICEEIYFVPPDFPEDSEADGEAGETGE